MSIQFNCSSCNQLIEAPDERAGAKWKCSHCQEKIRVPSQSQSTPQRESIPSPPIKPRSRPRAQLTSSGFGERDWKSVKCELCGVKNVRSAQNCKACGEPMAEQKKKPNKHDVQIGEVVAETRDIFQQQFGLTIGAVILPLFIFIVAYFVGAFVFFLLVFALLGALGGGSKILLLGAQFVFFTFAGAFFTYLSSGTYLILNKIVRGKQTNIGQLLSGTPYFLRLFSNSFLIWIIYLIFIFAGGIVVGILSSVLEINFDTGGFTVLIGMMILSIMSLFWLIFWPLPYFIIDRDERGIQPILSCFSYLQHHWIASFVAIAICAVVTIIGTLLLVVGLVVTIPFCLLMFAVMYCHLTGRRTAA